MQSGIWNETLGVLDLAKETWNRISGYKYNYRTRLIPIWSLIIPGSLYFVGIYFGSVLLEKCIKRFIIGFKKIFSRKVFKIVSSSFVYVVTFHSFLIFLE
jgi:hypothetical protein